MIKQSRGAGCSWPWPFIKLSNGFELETDEVLRVRCLRDFDNAKAKQIVAVRHSMGGLELVKFGSGNRRYLTIKNNPVEGEDFEILPKEKVWLAKEQARQLVAAFIGPSAAKEREDREIGERSYL